jgi:hypothetical protein
LDGPHAVNLAKGTSSSLRIGKSRCPFCAASETQQHINATCTHPLLVKIRRIHRRRIDDAVDQKKINKYIKTLPIKFGGPINGMALLCLLIESTVNWNVVASYLAR